MPYGASTKNAGFSCFGSVSELLDDISVMGEQACMDVVKMRWQGLQKLKERVGEANLEYRHDGGTELFLQKDSLLKSKCLDSLDYCNDLIDAHLNLKNCYANKANEILKGFDKETIFNQYEGTINPFSMMQQLKRICQQLQIEILYGIEIESIQQADNSLFTKHGLCIPFKKLIICTNGFAAKLLPELKVIPARNQVLITKPLPNLNLTSGYHVDKGYIYFRQYEGRILLGGGRNIDPITETTAEFGNTELIQNYLKEVLETIYEGAGKTIDFWWSGILGIGPSKYPIVEWVSEDILVGVRLGGMGVAIGSHLGNLLAEEVAQA